MSAIALAPWGAKLRHALALAIGLCVFGGSWVAAGQIQPDPRKLASTQATSPQTLATQPGQRPGGPSRRGPDGRTDWKWWKDEAAQKELGLTSAQVKKINDIYDTRLAEIRLFLDELNTQQALLDKMVSERMVDDTAIQLQAGRVELPRARVNESRTVMLYRIYRVLTVRQNDQLPGVRERHMAGRGGRGGH
jgi:Spy/CpxP family protein refolding chaperone